MWKILPSAPEYECSQEGQIRRLTRGKSNRSKSGVTLKQQSDRDGYKTIILFIRDKTGKCKRKRRRVHQLILETFIGNRPNILYHGTHNDGNLVNNKLSNLSWKTPQNNIKDRIRHGTCARGERIGKSKLKTVQIKEIKKLYNGKHGELVKLSKKYHVTPQAIGHIIRGKNWKHVS